MLLVLASIATYAFIAAQKPAAASAAATLTIYKGTAQRAPAGSNTFTSVLSGQGLNAGDQVRTGAATAAAIRFGDGSITRLDSNTTITIRTLTHQGTEYQTSFAQSAGKTWNKVQRLVGVASYNVTGPNSSTAEVRGTTFVLIIEPNGDVRIDDYNGTVIFHGKAGSVTVTTGQSSTILNGASTPQPVTGIPTADLQDPFTVFNIAADANLDATGNGDILSVNANNTIAVAETQGAFVGGAADGNSDLSFTLDWPGSTFELVIIDPDGVEYDSIVSDQHPVTYTVPKPRAGDWSYQVHDISSEKPKENWSVVVGAVRPARQTPNLFFRGGAKQVCDHSVIGGKGDTWSVRARDSAGAPTLSSSDLPDYGTFIDDHHGTGTFKFTPPSDVAPADIPITITSSFGGGSASLSCTEHVVPPKDASVGGRVVSGSSGVSGVLITLTMPDSSTQIAFSDGAGNFGFNGLGAGNFTLAMTVPNGYKASGPISQTVTLDGKTAGSPVSFTLVPFAISLASLPNGSVGDPSCSVLNLLNGVPPITWSVSSGAMPTGTTFDAYGHCSGTPTAAGTFTFTLSATDANGDTARHSYTVTIFPAPSINGPSPAIAPIKNLKTWDLGFANPQTLTGAGGIPPYTWSVVSGALPAGMSLGAATGSLDGGPTGRRGTFAVGIQLTDSAGAKAYRTIFLTIGRPPAYFGNPSINDIFVRGQEVSNRFDFQYGVAPYTLTATGLPPGITATITGTEPPGCDCSDPIRVQLSGVANRIGTFKPVLTVHDAVGGSATLTGSMLVIAAGLSITSPVLPQAIELQPFSAQFTAAGGVGPRNWSASLPQGLNIDPATGLVTGAPLQAGCNTAYVNVGDNWGFTYTSFALDVLPANSGITFCTATSLPPGEALQSYSTQLVAIGGAGPLTWSPLSFPPNSVQPSNLSIGPTTGLISGTFSQADAPFTWTFTASVTDGSMTAQQTFTLVTFNPPDLGPKPLPAGTTGASYSVTLPIPNFTIPYVYPQVVSGTLPPGLYVSDCGYSQPCIFGTPTTADPNPPTFTLVATDGLGFQGAPMTYTIPSIATSPMTFNNTGPLQRTTMVGVRTYNDYFYVNGGSDPYTWTLTGALPPGLIFSFSNGSANITGSATAPGTYTSSIQVTDGLGANPPAPISYTIVVDPNLSITTATLPGGDAGQAYSRPVAATGGSGGLSFGMTGVCDLFGDCVYPSANLQIDPNTGVISTVNAPAVGTEVFQVFVDDSHGNQATMDYAIYFGDPTAIVTTSLPNAALKSGYCQSLVAHGGTPGYAWALSGGSLPTGVALDSYGHLTGTPTVAGVYSFTITLTDTSGQTATRSYTVTIS